jgi:hypothetical protein
MCDVASAVLYFDIYEPGEALIQIAIAQTRTASGELTVRLLLRCCRSELFPRGGLVDKLGQRLELGAGRAVL